MQVYLPEDAYFDQSFKFTVNNGTLSSQVRIGYGVLQYIDDYFLLCYKEDGISLSFVDADSHGPFIGYVANNETSWIDLYTEKNGAYVGRIPYKIFHDWIATDRNSEGWQPGWEPDYIHYYYAEFGDFRWAAAHLTSTVMGSGRKTIATSTDGGQTWSFGSTMDDYGGFI